MACGVLLPGPEDAMALLSTNHQSNLQTRLEELERRNQLLEAEIERLQVYKDYAYTDALTEIPNRRFYYERLLQEVARARRGPHSLTLALVDLDLFKEINEQVGHRGGDQVLKFFSQFLRVNLRQEDVVCRIGGDEFAIIMPDTTPDRAAIFFERVKQKLDQVEISVDGRPALTFSFSCGLARFNPEYLPEDLIEEADHSLYSAKARGRNRVVAASTDGALVSRSVH
jgi:two-component system cell cycle response regulator